MSEGRLCKVCECIGTFTCTHKLNKCLKDVYVKFVSASAPFTCTHKLNKCLKDVYVKFVSASAPFTHAWTPEKKSLILIILQCNTEHTNIFLHIPGLKSQKLKFCVVDDFGTLTTWRHMKTSNLKRKDQTRHLALCTLHFFINFKLK
jgi:hypothetical protein